MKFVPPDNRHAVSIVRLTLALAVAALLPLLLYGSTPSWWTQRGVLVEHATAGDYAPVNQGQLKNIAKAAVAEMDAKLSGGAGDELHALIASWASADPGTNDYAPVNLGQVKNVARPFFDRLIAAGVVDYYPWQRSLDSPDDFAIANIGQVKNLFSFYVPVANLIQEPLGDRIAAGRHSANLALQTHAIWIWGDNFSGGSDFERNHPRRINEFSSISSVSAGPRHLVALRSDGSVWTWGENALGQLGNGTLVNRSTPALVPNVANIVSVKAGGLHTLALQQDGTVIAWGDNYYGQLGTGDTTGSAIPKLVVGLDNVRRVAAGYQRSVALRNDGTVWNWGYDHYSGGDIFSPSPVAVPDLVDVVDVATGYAHTVALKADGTVWAWGSNYANQIGNGSSTGKFQEIPIQVPNLSNIVKIASTYEHSLALASDGTVWAWGDNFSGQLGDGTNQTRQTPVQVNGLSDVIAIATASSHSLAMKADGTVWTWGDGATGTLPGANLHFPQLVGLGIVDGNQNEMDDRWEMQFFSNFDQSADADFDGDGISNRHEYLRGTDPTDYFNGVNPVIEIASGNNQVGDAGTFLTKPFKIQVRNPAGQLLVNAPVTFSIVDGAGALAATAGGVQQQSLMLRTDMNGEAWAYHALSAAAGTSTRTTVKAGKSAAPVFVTFRGIVRLSLPTPLPTATPPPDPNTTPTPTPSPSPTTTPIPPYRYAIIDLGKEIYPYRINNLGQILLEGIDQAGNWGKFRWKGGNFEKLTFAENNVEFGVKDINDVGAVVGSFTRYAPWIQGGENELGGGLHWPANSTNATKVSGHGAFKSFDIGKSGTFRSAGLNAINNKNELFGQEATGSVRGFGTQIVMNSQIWPAPSVPLSIMTATNTSTDSDLSTWQGSYDKIRRANAKSCYIGRKFVPNTGPLRVLRGVETGMVNGQSVPFEPVDINEGEVVIGYNASGSMIIAMPKPTPTPIPGASPSTAFPSYDYLTLPMGDPLAINDHTRPALSPTANSPQPTPIPVPQFISWVGNALVMWELQPEAKTWHPFGLEEMIPSMDGWQYLEPYDMNDSGTIIGRGWYTDPSNPQAEGEYHAFLLVPVGLIPDFNRDGIINNSDPGHVTENEPWRWWINDDDDELDTVGKDIPGALNPNFETTPILSGIEVGTIDGIRDLVDFFPLYLDIRRLLELFPVEGSSPHTFNLRQEDGSVNFVYTDLRSDTASNYLRTLNGDARDNATALGGTTRSNGAATNRITKEGVALDPAWLKQITTDGGGIILVEGRARSDQPIVLDVQNSAGKQVAQVSLPLKISPVEQMYRHKNLMAADNASGGAVDYATGSDAQHSEPENYPDNLCNNKSFVFVHGYNVSPDDARGWNAEIFKRLFQAGSRAKFYGVTWHGDEREGTTIPHYHSNVNNAFATAKPFAEFFATLGEAVVTAHSLGNVVTGSAIHDWGAAPQHYFMVDAAVTLESYDRDIAGDDAMTHPDWKHYQTRVYASEWYGNPGLAVNDGRRKLTWKGRFSNVSERVYNFYSSSENVLRKHEGDPGNFTDTFWTQIFDSGLYAWALQEKLKGRQVDRNFGFIHGKVGSTYGGWRFSTNIYPPGPTSSQQAAQLSDQSVTTNPVFDPGFTIRISPPSPGTAAAKDIHNGAPSWIVDLTDPIKGSATATVHANQLLAELFPARTLPAGANNLAIVEDRNFDMSSLYRNGWPNERGNDIDWKHSDVKVVAFSYICPLFDKFKSLADLDK